MEILIVAENLTQATYWERLIGLVVPDSNIVCWTISEICCSNYQDLNYDLLFLVSIDGNTDFYQWIEYATNKDIPFICSVDQITGDVIDQLMKFGVKGYVNVHCPMDELQTAIRIVCEKKGTFLKFVN